MSQTELPSQHIPNPENPDPEIASKPEGSKPEDPLTSMSSQEHHNVSSTFAAFLQELAKVDETEHKLERAIHFMEGTISQTGSPHFKDFWDAKKLCVDLFKGNINPSVRVHLWSKYSELCREARRLKEIFDEQSAFAVEQIEIALKAVEDEVQHIPTHLQEMLEKTPGIDYFDDSRFLQSKYAAYNELQQELNLFNAYASKITALRKELIKTEMRIRNKNRFFQRLSHVGDLIFPRRKELISKLSELFKQDIHDFISHSFAHEVRTPELFDIREEIKALQHIAKLLTLNTEVFSHTRLQLSECWDSIKNLISERKKIANEQRSIFKQQKDVLHLEIDGLKKEFEAGSLTIEQAEVKIDDIAMKMRKAQLGKPDIRELRDEIHALRDIVFEKVRSQQSQEKNSLREREAKIKQRFEEIKQKVDDLHSKQEILSFDEVSQELAALTRLLATLAGIQDSEKLAVEKEIHSIKDRAHEKRAQAIFALSTDDKEKLEQMKAMLAEEKKERQEVKARLEVHRRMKGSSSLDFGEALQYNDTVSEEKERLEKINASIEKLEDQIAELEG